MLNFICNLRSILKFITFNLVKQERKSVEKMRLKIDEKIPENPWNMRKFCNAL